MVLRSQIYQLPSDETYARLVGDTIFGQWREESPIALRIDMTKDETLIAEIAEDAGTLYDALLDPDMVEIYYLPNEHEQYLKDINLLKRLMKISPE